MAQCSVIACKRDTGQGSDWICGRCWRLADPDLRLVMEDIRAMWSTWPPSAAGFIQYAWECAKWRIMDSALCERSMRRSPAYEPHSSEPRRYHEHRAQRLALR